MIDAETFNKAMTLWFDLTGLDPNAKSFKMGSLGLLRASESIRDAVTMDPSMITAYLLLDAYSTAYFKDAKVSVHEFDEDPDKVFDYMDKVREFKKLIRAPEIMEEADRFRETLRKALISYGVDWERVATFIDQRDRVAYIRRDALISAKNLRADHFLHGDVEPAGVKPVYNKQVFGYWNINNLINHACGMPSGVALNLIRDPDELHSFFIFSIRNGGNLITLTDITEYAHPLGRYMSRRPDRTFEDRAGQNWFPYQFLQIAFNEKGEAYHDIWSEAKAQDIVAYQPTHFNLAPITDMEIEQIAWTSLMFDLIVERYWNKAIEPKPLSYTNEMIKLVDKENPLLAAAAKANLPIAPYTPPPLPRLSNEDVFTDALDEAAIGKKYEGWEHRYGRNRWMEERYGAAVPNEALNLIGIRNDGRKSEALFLEGGKDKHAGWHSAPLPVPYDGEIMKAIPDTFGHIGGDRRRYRLEKVDTTLFGPIAQLDADRKFIARHNFAHALQRAADNEFDEKKDEVLRWYDERVRANTDTVLSFIHHETCYGVFRSEDEWGTASGDQGDKLRRYTFSHLHDHANAPKEEASFDRRYKVEKDTYYFGAMSAAQVTLHSGYVRSRDNMACFVNEGVRSTYSLFIKPGKLADIALLAGCEMSEIPEILSHWRAWADDTYVGNQILNRIDPLEWAVSNPWNKMDFSIRVHLSRSAYKKLLKTIPQPAIEQSEGIQHVGMKIVLGGHHNRSQVEHSNWNLESDSMK